MFIGRFEGGGLVTDFQNHSTFPSGRKAMTVEEERKLTYDNNGHLSFLVKLKSTRPQCFPGDKVCKRSRQVHIVLYSTLLYCIMGRICKLRLEIVITVQQCLYLLQKNLFVKLTIRIRREINKSNFV